MIPEKERAALKGIEVLDIVIKEDELLTDEDYLLADKDELLTDEDVLLTDEDELLTDEDEDNILEDEKKFDGSREGTVTQYIWNTTNRVYVYILRRREFFKDFNPPKIQRNIK